MTNLTTQQEIEREETEFDIEDRFLDEAAAEADERDGPNSPGRDALIERIVERKWEAYYQSND